jgi:hypothetical protein
MHFLTNQPHRAETSWEPDNSSAGQFPRLLWRELFSSTREFATGHYPQPYESIPHPDTRTQMIQFKLYHLYCYRRMDGWRVGHKKLSWPLSLSFPISNPSNNKIMADLCKQLPNETASSIVRYAMKWYGAVCTLCDRLQGYEHIHSLARLWRSTFCVTNFQTC